MDKILQKPLLLLAGVTLGAIAMLWAWKPWRQPDPAGRVILAEPVEHYDPDYVYTLPTPAAPDWRRTGEVVDCPVIEPDSRSAESDIAIFGDEPLGDLLFIDPEVGDLPYGGSLRVRRPPSDAHAEQPPLVEVDLRASRPPLGRWDALHALSLQGGVATAQDGDLEQRLRLNYRPGEAHLRRRWSAALDLGVEYRPDNQAGEGFRLYALGDLSFCPGTDCR